MPASTVRKPVPILLGLADEVGDLPLDRVEALVEIDDRGLSRGRVVGEAGGVGGAALWEDLPLHLLHLLFEPLDPLLRAWRRLALRGRAPPGRG